jgi:hypothetical protein
MRAFPVGTGVRVEAWVCVDDAVCAEAVRNYAIGQIILRSFAIREKCTYRAVPKYGHTGRHGFA